MITKIPETARDFTMDQYEAHMRTGDKLLKANYRIQPGCESLVASYRQSKSYDNFSLKLLKIFDDLGNGDAISSMKVL